MSMHHYLHHKHRYSSSSQQLYHLRPCVLLPPSKCLQATGFRVVIVASQEHKHHHD